MFFHLLMLISTEESMRHEIISTWNSLIRVSYEAEADADAYLIVLKSSIALTQEFLGSGSAFFHLLVSSSHGFIILRCHFV